VRALRALIVGGGLGGLATALALRKIGFECLVLEQSDHAHRQSLGTGISLWCNALLALRELGLEEQVLQSGSVIQRTVTMTGRGRILNQIDIAAIGRSSGAVSVCLPRSELRRILVDALPPDVVRNGARCVSFAVRGAIVIAHMSDGSTTTGDLLIGADGLYSPVRSQLLGTQEPRFGGYVSWRGLATFDMAGIGTVGRETVKQGDAILATGSGSCAGLFPCGNGHAYWFATRNTPPHADLEISNFLDRYPAPIRNAIQATPPDTILRHDVADRIPAPVWGKGPVTLLGDAAHPCTPSLGQGACQALEDALMLAKCLSRPEPVADALRVYELRRQPRTAMVVNESWKMGQILQTEDPILVTFRDLLNRSPVGRLLARRLLSQLFAGQQ
jgi:2-polyprenyl-6-methoxyphenol hydroxylase-like FAD-dependent oxidoreductase